MGPAADRQQHLLGHFQSNWGTMVLFFFNYGEFKNTTKSFWGEVHVKNFWPKKLRNKKLFPCRLFPSIFLSRFFGRFSA
jgi:hypothetical protein